MLTELLQAPRYHPCAGGSPSGAAGRRAPAHRAGDRRTARLRSGSPSRLVASVVAPGLVERREHETDGRAVALRLTSKGQAAARSVSQAERQLYDTLLTTLPERDVASLNRTLRKLVKGRATGDAIARRRTRG